MGVSSLSRAEVISLEPEKVKKLIEEIDRDGNYSTSPVSDLTIEGNSVFFNSEGYNCYGDQYATDWGFDNLLFKQLLDRYQGAIACFEYVTEYYVDYHFADVWLKLQADIDWDDPNTYTICNTTIFHDTELSGLTPEKQDEIWLGWDKELEIRLGELKNNTLWTIFIDRLESQKDYLPNLYLAYQKAGCNETNITKSLIEDWYEKERISDYEYDEAIEDCEKDHIQWLKSYGYGVMEAFGFYCFPDGFPNFKTKADFPLIHDKTLISTKIPLYFCHPQKEKYLINQCLNINSLSDEEAARLHGKLCMYIEALVMQNEHIGKLFGKENKPLDLLDSNLLQFEVVEEYLIPLWLRTCKPKHPEISDNMFYRVDLVDYETIIIWENDEIYLSGMYMIPFVYALSSRNFTGDSFFCRLIYDSDTYDTYAVNGKTRERYEFLACVLYAIAISAMYGNSTRFNYQLYFEESGIPEHIIELLKTPEKIQPLNDVPDVIIECFKCFDDLSSSRDAYLGLIKLGAFGEELELTI